MGCLKIRCPSATKAHERDLKRTDKCCLVSNASGNCCKRCHVVGATYSGASPLHRVDIGFACAVKHVKT